MDCILNRIRFFSAYSNNIVAILPCNCPGTIELVPIKTSDNCSGNKASMNMTGASTNVGL